MYIYRYICIYTLHVIISAPPLDLGGGWASSVQQGGGGDGGIGACCLGQGGDGHALSRCFRRQTMVWYIYFRIYMIFITF